MAKIYKMQNGVKVPMNNREVKQYIMRQNNWTAEEYDKNYDILRNKLRNYENYQRQQGVQVNAQSVQELLLKEARAKQRHGTSYKPSIKMKQIQSFSSRSSGKRSYGKRAIQRIEQTYDDATYNQFKGLIEANPQAKKIYESIKNPVKRERALTAYANKLHLSMNEQDEYIANQAIPFGEVYGSDISIDFRVEDYE